MKNLKEPVAEPWMVHIYGKNRKLLWVLEPSHGWLFLLGVFTGLTLAIVHFNLARSSPAAERAPVVPNSTHSPALQVD